MRPDPDIEHLEALYVLADELHRSASEQDVFTAALHAIRRALRVDRAAILLCDDGGVMRFTAWHELSEGYRRAAEGHSPWPPDADQPAPVVINDAAGTQFARDLQRALAAERIRALAFIPLLSGGRLVGKFMAYSDVPRSFTDSELHVALTIGRHLAFALDRCKAEAALRASETRYRALVENQSEMICRFRPDGTILFANTAYARARNATPEALTRMSYWSFIPPEDHVLIRSMMARLTPDSPEAAVENRFETAEGPRWFLWTNRALAFDEHGRWSEGQATGIDITDRKRAEEQLRRSHETFFNLIHNAPFGIYLVDSQFRLIEVSAGSQKVFSHVSPLLGRDFGEVMRKIWPEPAAEQFLALFRRTLETGERFHEPNTTQRRADTDEVETYDWRIERITLPDGEFGVVCYFYDMTERRAADEALRLNEERYRAIVSIITDVPWITDASGRFVMPQPAWARYTGQTWEQHHGYGWLDALHPDDRERLRTEWEHGQARGERFESRGRFWHAASRSWRHFVVKAAPRRREDGTILEWVGSCTDEENEIRSEMELKKARDEAVSANRAKDDFLATLSHELRTPLNPVLLVASDGAENPALPEGVRRDFKLIADNVGLEARLIDDLLDLNRITRGKVVLESRVLDLHAVVHDALATVADQIADKELRLASRLQARRPHVLGDPVRLRQVLWNVLKNAIKFTPAGGAIEISSMNPGSGSELILRIRDTGVGMDAADLARVFRPFVQGMHASSPDGGYGGLGLGLAISRALVEAHGGTITMTSPGAGRGATITIRLHAVAPAAPRAVQEPPRVGEPRGEAATDARRPRVLYVEDHDATRSTLSGLLSRRGYEIIAARSVAEARARARETAFDVLVSDLGLPDGDGCSLMTELRQSTPVLLGVALSGYGMDSDRARSAAAGFAQHLTKPVDIHALEQALKSVLHRRS